MGVEFIHQGPMHWKRTTATRNDDQMGKAMGDFNAAGSQVAQLPEYIWGRNEPGPKSIDENDEGRDPDQDASEMPVPKEEKGVVK